VLEVLYHHTKFGGARISPAAGAAKNVEFFVCWSRFRRSEFCAPDFAMNALQYRNGFDTVRQGKVCSSTPCSTFSDCRQLSTPLNAEVQKRQKLGVFAARGPQNKPIETKFGM